MIEPKSAALKLAKTMLENGFNFETLHEYTDVNSNPLYWRIRLKHPETGAKWIRPMFYDVKNFKLGEPKFPNGKPLYRLNELAKPCDDPVFICEGEKCIDSLANLGILATTSGSADSASKTNWTILSKRKVILWSDNDEAGQRYMQTVAEILHKLQCKIKIIDVSALNLPIKGDAVDWLYAHPNATKEDILKLPLLDLRDPIKEEEKKYDDEKQNQTAELVAFITSHFTLFHDKNRNVYAQNLETKETKKLDSVQFRDFIAADFYSVTEKVARDQNLREALNVCAGLARYKGECRDIFIRVAQHGNSYFLDLGEVGKNRAIEIKAGNWKIVNNPPVCFLRPETLLLLPEPVPNNGDISVLWEIVNIPEDTRLLVIAWLGECLRPDTPFPLLELIGEQGSAKSTTQTVLRKLIDPNACNLRAAPKNPEDIFVSAGVNWLASFENISHLSPQMQDALCVLSTGGGFAKRKLYTNTEESVINVQRPIILNGISIAVTAQDLIDRTLSVETPVITARTETTDLWKIFDSEHPKLLGALLNIVAKALCVLPDISIAPEDRPRLIEFVRFGMAIAVAMGYPAETFLTQFNLRRSEAITRTIDASPVASAVIEWFERSNKRTTQLPIKELFNAVETFKPPYIELWPRSAKGFADALRRVAPALRQIGIECRSLGKIGGNVIWEISSKEK